MQGVEMMSLSSAIAHFLNCLLGSYTNPQNSMSNQKPQKAKKQSRRKPKNVFLGSGKLNCKAFNEYSKNIPVAVVVLALRSVYIYFDILSSIIIHFIVVFLFFAALFSWPDNTEWATETPKSLWKKITTEAKEYYRFSFEW